MNPTATIRTSALPTSTDLGLGAGRRPRQGMTRPQFARYYLMRLGIGNDLTRVALNPKFPYRLASMEDVSGTPPGTPTA